MAFECAISLYFNFGFQQCAGVEICGFRVCYTSPLAGLGSNVATKIIKSSPQAKFLLNTNLH